MSRNVGLWIDHRRAFIVSASAGEVTTRAVESDVEAHPRYAGQQDSGGEKKYEERHRLQLDRYYDEVIELVGASDALLILGPGEAKTELKKRLGQSKAIPSGSVDVEAADRLTDAQIVAKVKAHFDAAN